MDYFDYGDKALGSRYAAMTSPARTPSVSEIPASTDGTGLEVSGWFATFDEDSHGEQFLPNAFDGAIRSALAGGLPVLYEHGKKDVPCGFVKSMEVKPGGLWGTVILPAPRPGTKAAEIYDAVKTNLLRYFSVGGFWTRLNVGGKVKLLCDRLVEVSLASRPVNARAHTAGISAVQGVKSLGGGEWVLASVNDRIARDLGEHQAHRLALIDLKLCVVELRRALLCGG
jgi:HK97 family phage prohead protease